MMDSDSEENENSSSSRDPLNAEGMSDLPPQSGGPPPYQSDLPDYQEAIGFLSPAENNRQETAIINDGEAPPNYIELTGIRAPSASLHSLRSDREDGSESRLSSSQVRIVAPADIEAQIDGEQETALDGESPAPTLEVPALDTADVEDGSDGRLSRILERIRSRQRLLMIFPIVLTCFVLFLAIFPISFHYINFYTMALKTSKWTGWVDFSTVYDSGCYVIGPEMDFIRFDATSQVIDKTLGVTSTSSLSYKLRMAVIYRLRKSDLPILYRKFAGTYPAVLESVVLATAKNTAVEIDIDSWFSRRREMEKVLETAIATELNNTYHVDVINVYLLDIIFPPELLQRLMAQEELILKSATEEYKLSERVEQMMTTKQTMDVMNSANEITQDAKANAAYIKKVAVASGRVVTTNTLSNSLRDFRSNASITSNEKLMSAHMFVNLRTMASKNHLLVTKKNATRAFMRREGSAAFTDSLAMAAAATVPFKP